MITVIDNVIDQSKFINLQKEILSPMFPWYFTNSTSYKEDCNLNLDEFQFNHPLTNMGQLTSPVANRILYVAEEAAKKLNFEIDSYFRLMLVSSFYKTSQMSFPAHVDWSTEHFVMIYYINDSDGDTVIYNEKYDPQTQTSTGTQYPVKDYLEKILKNNLTVKETITPKENRLVVFDGLHYHSGHYPTKTQRRILVNIGFKKK